MDTLKLQETLHTAQLLNLLKKQLKTELKKVRTQNCHHRKRVCILQCLVVDNTEITVPTVMSHTVLTSTQGHLNFATMFEQYSALVIVFACFLQI